MAYRKKNIPNIKKHMKKFSYAQLCKMAEECKFVSSKMHLRVNISPISWENWIRTEDGIPIREFIELNKSIRSGSKSKNAKSTVAIPPLEMLSEEEIEVINKYNIDSLNIQERSIEMLKLALENAKKLLIKGDDKMTMFVLSTIGKRYFNTDLNQLSLLETNILEGSGIVGENDSFFFNELNIYNKILYNDKVGGWAQNFGYENIRAFRDIIDKKCENNIGNVEILKRYLKENPVFFINIFVYTVDPRNASDPEKSTKMPLYLFKRQVDLVEFLYKLYHAKESALIEKSRDMGATWVCCGFTIWFWLFAEDSSIGWGSRKEGLVDRIGVMDSIFEKMRFIIRNLPLYLQPSGFDEKKNLTSMKIINPENGTIISGESGDNIGRGGRNIMYFKDESAYYERPELIEASLSNNTDVQIDISSVCGVGNVFYNKRESGVEWDGGELVEGKINVFIMDWRDHPLKDQEWYDKKRKQAEDQGLLHLFSQEVDRNYSAAIVNTLLKSEWIDSAIDFHLKYDLKDQSAMNYAGLDVADSGVDRNALAIRNGIVLKFLISWTGEDTTQSARKCLRYCQDYGSVNIQYDCIGVGAGIKGEFNSLYKESYLSEKITYHPWNAGASPNNKDKRCVENDRDSPIVGAVYSNLKAQAWFELKCRFEKTYKVVNGLGDYSEKELISIPSDLSELNTLKKELLQVRSSLNSLGKIIIDKNPSGTKSPNLADAVVMAFNPVIFNKGEGMINVRYEDY